MEVIYYAEGSYFWNSVLARSSNCWLVIFVSTQCKQEAYSGWPKTTLRRAKTAFVFEVPRKKIQANLMSAGVLQ